MSRARLFLCLFIVFAFMLMVASIPTHAQTDTFYPNSSGVAAYRGSAAEVLWTWANTVGTPIVGSDLNIVSYPDNNGLLQTGSSANDPYQRVDWSGIIPSYQS